MPINYDKFDNAIDVEGLKQDVEQAKENINTGGYKEVPHDTYEVEVTKMELTESKKGDPMVSIWFKILAGDFKGSLLFYNQVITQGFQIHLVSKLLRSMGTGLNIEFETYAQFGQLVLDIHEQIDGKFEFAIEYAQKNNFPTFEITKVFEV